MRLSTISFTKTGLILGRAFILCFFIGCTVRYYDLHRKAVLIYYLSADYSNNNNEYNYPDEPEVNNGILSTSKFQTTLGTGVSTIATPTIVPPTIMEREQKTKKKKKKKEQVEANTKKKISAAVTSVISEAALTDFGSGSSDDSFSACILWMDDNFRLEEWLAYHYYIMKLRYVVIDIDPFSTTSPQHIVERWNDIEQKYPTINMTIVTWTESDQQYSSDYKSKMIKLKERVPTLQDGNKKKAPAGYHYYRQEEFYRTCSKHLLEQNKTWVSYHDTDEFITFQHAKKYYQEPGSIDPRQKTKQPGYVLHRLNAIKKQLPPNTYVNDTGMSCVSITRRRYCSKELSDDETNQLLSSSLSTTTTNDNGNGNSGNGVIPENLFRDDNKGTNNNNNDEIYNNTIQRFDTLRYKYSSPGDDGLPKSFIDLSQVNPRLYIQNQYKGKIRRPQQWGVHFPMFYLCRNERKNQLANITTIIKNERFIINHYLGSWAAYSSRVNDARIGVVKKRTYKKWQTLSTMTNGEHSHLIRPWLQSFVKLVGLDAASYLLQDAGKIPTNHNVTGRINEYNQKMK